MEIKYISANGSSAIFIDNSFTKCPLTQYTFADFRSEWLPKITISTNLASRRSEITWANV